MYIIQVAVSYRTQVLTCVKARRSTQQPYAPWMEEHARQESDVTQNYEIISLNGPPNSIQIQRNTDLTFCGWRAENCGDGSPEETWRRIEYLVGKANYWTCLV